VTLGGLLAAHRITGSVFKNAKVFCVGAGSSGVGVCNTLIDGMA
jgi:malic enzyme